MSQNFISLLELNTEMKNTLKSSFKSPQWIIAEISEIRDNYSGHCYLELIEKNTENDNIIAKAKANIWSYTYRILKPYFETSTGQSLCSGLKILISVNVEFHENYGFSLNIKDIDPSYTIGDIAKRRRLIISKLEEEGVLNMNKEVAFPMVPQKIAIISSETAAGYGDFVQHLNNNRHHFKFYHKLFPAYMQGENAETSIIAALDKIYKNEHVFDLVVIIRGGGSQADLSCFDNYNLAYYITQFPLPILSGIGHERDDTIVDMVAYSKMKTPTAVADFIISYCDEFYDYFTQLQDQFISSIESIVDDKKDQLKNIENELAVRVTNMIKEKKNVLKNITSNLQSITKNYISHKRKDLVFISQSGIKNNLQQFFQRHQYQLQLLEKSNQLSNPENILKRGFSITLKNGKVLKDTDQIIENDIIETKLYKGTLTSIVKKGT